MKIVVGNLFLADAKYLLHQVNCKGIMGGGLARQVREQFPHVYAEYKTLCDKHKDNSSALLGTYQEVEIGDGRVIVNVFSQDDIGWGSQKTDYVALEKALKSFDKHHALETVALPYLMGCVRGGGKWEVVSNIIRRSLVDCNVTLYKYKGEK